MNCDTSPVMKQLRLIREDQGLSQEYVGKRAGTSKSGMSDYESGKQCPKLPTVRRIADVLGYDVDISLNKTPRLNRK